MFSSHMCQGKIIILGDLNIIILVLVYGMITFVGP